MKGVLPWMVYWARRADIRDFILPFWLLWPVQYKFFFPDRTLFHLFVPIAYAATWTSCVGSPLS